MKVLLFANTDWYLYNFRLALAEAIRDEGHEVILLSPPGRYAERLRQAGFRWLEFPLARRRINPLVEFLILVRLALLYRRERPDLVHHFTVKCVLYGSIAARLAGVKAVVNALAGLGHIFSDNGLKTRLLRRVVKTVCRVVLRQTQVIFQNPDDRRVFLECKLVDRKNCYLIRGSGVDTKRFKPPATGVAGGQRYVLLASRLLWAKGVAEYVEAARDVRRTLPGTTFLLAGEADAGNPASIPQQVIDEWQRQGDVEVLGHCEDMRGLIERVDLVALPTYYGEGVPRILVEAAASGKALVATAMPGCTEIVRQGWNGRLVPARNSLELACAIKELLLDDEQRAQMGRRSRRLAQEFSEDIVIARTFRVYHNSLPLETGAGSSAWSGETWRRAKEAPLA